MSLFWRFVRFGLVGGSGVLVDMGVLYLLHDPKRLALPLVLSKVLSAQVAILNNFTWNERWTFGDRAAQRAAGHARLLRFFRFELICLAGLAIAVGVLKLCVDRLGLHYQVGNAIAIAIATAWNFLVNLRWNWAEAGGPGADGLVGRPLDRTHATRGSSDEPIGPRPARRDVP